MADERPFRVANLLLGSADPHFLVEICRSAIFLYFAGLMNLQFPAVKLIGRNVLSARMISQAKNCSALVIIAITVQLKLDRLILLSNCRGFMSSVCALDLCGPRLAKVFHLQLC